jgi:membrane associated rhomboid family serine protease
VVLPLRDINPTLRTPVMTLLLITACLAAWIFWQKEPQRDPTQDLIFNLEYAAIPCELVQGRPLTEGEVLVSFGSSVGDTQSCNFEDGGGTPWDPGKEIWLAVISSMFFHGGLLHIGGNMLYLWIFGNNIEDHLGPIRYLLFYLAGGLAATATHVALQPDSTVPLVGASGAIAAVMGAYLVWFPNAPVRTVVLLGLPILTTIRARWLLWIWFAMQFFTSPDAGVATGAHVGGFVFGLAVGALVRTTTTARRLAWRAEYRNAPMH